METVHPSVTACTSVITSSHFEDCGASPTEAEEATEEKGTTRSFRLRFRRASACASVSVFMVHTRT